MTEKHLPQGKGEPSIIQKQLGNPNTKPEVEVLTPTPGNTNVLPTVNYSLHSVAGEAELRARILSTVTVDTNGVAHSVNPDTGTEVLLAAVTVDAQKTATLATLKLVEGALNFAVGADKPTRFGFFFGHRSYEEICLAFRMGMYPATPLVTESRTDREGKEIFVGLQGIKPHEVAEQKWANQLDLFGKLGFNPSRSRGVFDKFHRKGIADQWSASPLVTLPDDMLDLLKHHDPNKLSINLFQMLFYSTTSRIAPDHSQSLGKYLGIEESPQIYSFGTRGIGVGFGEAVNRQGQVTGIDINSLEGAFQVVMVPANS